jgi:rare lipoprotein A
MISWKMISRVCPAAALMFAATGPTLAGSVGVASYYGKGFHGRRAANGEVFDMHAMTVAHKSLPFGTKLQVTNMSNGKSVVVRVQDRGPYIRGRVLDLSFGAAQAIGMIQSGTAKVKYAKL